MNTSCLAFSIEMSLLLHIQYTNSFENNLKNRLSGERSVAWSTIRLSVDKPPLITTSDFIFIRCNMISMHDILLPNTDQNGFSHGNRYTSVKGGNIYTSIKGVIDIYIKVVIIQTYLWFCTVIKHMIRGVYLTS